MKKFLSFIAPVLVLIASVGATAILQEAKPPANKVVEESRSTSVYVDQVRKENVVLTVATQGEVRAKTVINLIPQVTGRIVSISSSFNEGGIFNEGDSLIQIDDSNYQLAYIRAEARVAEAKVSLEQELADARIKAKQWRDWVKEGEPTPLALNKPQVAEAQAKLRAAEADLEEARLDLDRTQIRLPFSGRVMTRDVGLGQFVNAGNSIGRVFATDTVEIRLPLTDQQLAELDLPIGYVASLENSKGPKVKFHTTIGGITHTWEGFVKRINATIDQQTRLVYAIAEVENPYAQNKPRQMPLAVGLFVDATIESLKSQDALVIPRTALRSDNKVFVVTEGGKLDIRQVSLLASDDNRAMISGGLKVGERVVTSVLRAPFDGMDVQAIQRSAEKSSTITTASSSSL